MSRLGPHPRRAREVPESISLVQSHSGRINRNSLPGLAASGLTAHTFAENFATAANSHSSFMSDQIVLSGWIGVDMNFSARNLGFNRSQDLDG